MYTGSDFDTDTVNTIGKVIKLARCLGRGPTEMGAWQNELDFGRLLEAAVADRICLEMTARGYVPRIDHDAGEGRRVQCTYQGKGVWRVHEPVDEAGGEITKYETGTQHLLDLVPFEGMVAGLRAYVGHLASKRLDGLREELATTEERLAAL